MGKRFESSTRNVGVALTAAMLALGCGAEGVTEARSPTGGAAYTAKCKSTASDCVAMARDKCPTGYDTIGSESHAGGALADAIPGPVTWYTLTFRCGAPSEQLDPGPQVELARRDALSRAVWPSCDEPRKPGKCGLVADHFMSDEHIAKYVANFCHEDPAAMPSEVCRKAFRADFFDDVRARYPLAVVRDVDTACSSNPDGCTTLLAVELQFLRSHNAGVARAFDTRVDEIAAAYEAGRRKATSSAPMFARSDSEGAALAIRAIGEGLRAFGDGWQRASKNGSSVPEHRGAESSTDTTSGAVAGGGPIGREPASCTSDSSCGRMGYTCLRPAGSYQSGTCVKALNRFGTQDFVSGMDMSIGPAKRQCDFSTPCPAGFTRSAGQCVKGY